MSHQDIRSFTDEPTTDYCLRPKPSPWLCSRETRVSGSVATT